MNLIEILLNPISLAFTVIVIGYCIGNIKCYGISLDLAGVLIAAVIFGYIIASYNVLRCNIVVSDFSENMQMFSSFGTSLFVSVIGITTGYSLNLRIIKNAKAMPIGALMVVSSFALMKLIAILDKDISYSKLIGSLCGALTTTPGLSAATELKNVITEEAMLGYGCTYLLGVIAVVLCVQFFAWKSVVFEMKTQNADESKSALGGLIQIGITVLLGRLLGGICFGNFSLGNSGGILFVGILFGIIVKTILAERIASKKSMEIYRNLGLILFFVGNGIPAGMEIGNGFDAKIIIYGALMTAAPIGVGIILSRLIMKDNRTSTVIAGGMTSTPAIGVLLQKKHYADLSCYSMAYVGALLTITVLIRTL